MWYNKGVDKSVNNRTQAEIICKVDICFNYELFVVKHKAFANVISNQKEMLDVTMLQRYLAELSELSAYGMAAADVNHDGILDINDATLIQRYLAEMADF